MDLTYTDTGSGHPVLLLHGGGGPQSVAPWGAHLAETRPARVVVPTHPGFAGTPRPDSTTTVADLAALYVALLDELDLSEVTVVGNSIGGWIAAEMALLASPRVSAYVIVGGVGIEVPDHPVADLFTLTPAELAARSYADPATYGLDPTTLSPEALTAMAGNRATVEVYAGHAMADPTLRDRLAAVTAPVLVVWGEADRMVDPTYGAAYAAAVPGARFEVVRGAGHLPQVEQPDALVELVWGFVEEGREQAHGGS